MLDVQPRTSQLAPAHRPGEFHARDQGAKTLGIRSCTRANNMTAEKATKPSGSASGYESRTDIVVDRRSGEIDVIGFIR